MRFSVIIPAYNAERTIESCLNSLRDQSFSDFEAIIVDDGSADRTGVIVEKFAAGDKRFRYIRQENQGVSRTRNHGLDLALGEFVVFLDSDDRYAPEYLQTFDALISAQPACDHYWCGYTIVDTNGKEQGTVSWNHHEDTQFLDRAQIMDLHGIVLDAALWNKAFRRQIIEQHRLRMDESLSLGEDLLFNFAYLDAAKTQIMLINQPLYLYTKAENGTLDSKYRENLAEVYEILNDRLLAFLQKWTVGPDQIAKYYSSVVFTMERVLRNTFRPECTWSAKEKRSYNEKLMKSERFRTALRESECYLHPLYRFAYEQGSWRMVQFWDKLVHIKATLTRGSK